MCPRPVPEGEAVPRRHAFKPHFKEALFSSFVPTSLRLGSGSGSGSSMQLNEQPCFANWMDLCSLYLAATAMDHQVLG